MDAPTLPLHLNFLNDAAHLLRASAPGTSAHLMSHHNELMLLNGVEQTDTRRQHVCGACGHIMIPGQGTTLKMETEKAMRRKRGGIKAKDPKAKAEPHQRSSTRKLFTCGKCAHTTKIVFPPAPPVTRRRTKAEKAKNRQAGVTLEPTKPVTANSSSKKRAKNRKAGLQALLSQAKNSSSSAGRSLSLADFAR